MKLDWGRGIFLVNAPSLRPRNARHCERSEAICSLFLQNTSKKNGLSAVFLCLSMLWSRLLPYQPGSCNPVIIIQVEDINTRFQARRGIKNKLVISFLGCYLLVCN